MVLTSGRLLVGIWLAFVARGLFYSSTLPMWEGFDEYAHFCVIQHLALHGEWPSRSANCSREVELSLDALPLPRMLPLRRTFLSHDEYWRLPDEERSRLQTSLRQISPTLGEVPPVQPVPLYEAQQAPLYYWVSTLPYNIFSDAPLTNRVWILRLCNVLVGSLVIPLTFWCARRWCSDRSGLLASLFVACLPQYAMTSARIANDATAAALAALVLWQLARGRPVLEKPWAALALGLTAGLALLAKAYLLALVPGILVFYLYSYWESQGSRRRIVTHGLICLAGTVAMAGWWYASNLQTMGNLTGEQNAVALAGTGAVSLDRILHTNWLQTVDFLLISHFWLGNWSFLVARSWMYHLLFGMTGVAVAGMAKRLLLERQSRYSRPALAAMLVAQLTLLGGLGYHAMLSDITQGFPGTFGHYLDGLLAQEAILLTWGLEAVLGGYGLPCLAWMLVGLELFATHVYLLPYYSGLIAHQANGKLPAFFAGDYAGAATGLMLSRLAQNKPIFIGAIALGCEWLLFWAALLALAALVVLVSRRAAE